MTLSSYLLHCIDNLLHIPFTCLTLFCSWEMTPQELKAANLMPVHSSYHTAALSQLDLNPSAVSMNVTADAVSTADASLYRSYYSSLAVSAPHSL